MLNRKDHAKLFQFNQEFTSIPLRYGDLYLHQVGDVNYERGFEDTHKQWCIEISIILSGTGVFTVGENEYVVKENDIIINPNQGYHTIRSFDQRLRYLYLGFSFDEQADERLQLIKAFFESAAPPYKTTDQYGIAELLNRLLSEFHSTFSHSQTIIENYLKNILFLTHRTFTSEQAREVNFSGTTASVGATVYRVMKYVDTNLSSLTDIRALAKALNFNYSYLSHIFKQKTGVTLQQYIIYKKIEKSCSLIREGQTKLTDIALMLNYESLQAFSKAFKNIMGMSPTAYKTKYLGELNL